ncbi:MAG: N-acetyltransferase [Thermoplasmata archaeon]
MIARKKAVFIRPGTSKDFATIVQKYAPSGEGDPWDPFLDVEGWKRIKPKGLLVAECEGRYAGFLYWFLTRHPWFDYAVGSAAHVHELHVLPEFQGRGVGRCLVDRFLSDLRARHVATAYLETGEENQIERHLYESTGFLPIRRRVLYRATLGQTEAPLSPPNGKAARARSARSKGRTRCIPKHRRVEQAMP